MKIDVTTADIKNGVRGDREVCPIGLAAGRLCNHVWVSRYSIRLDGKKFHLPLEATGFINNFDHGDHVEPFSFDVEE